MEAWALGEDISCDEQTQGFQGNHINKHRMMYKAEGEEVKTKSGQIANRGTVKAAILKGGPDCKGLVAVSVYDIKPVHFLTVANTSIPWIEKEREVYAKDLGKKS
eukprot:15212713-Ditylum_brightwellii.AAC.2